MNEATKNTEPVVEKLVLESYVSMIHSSIGATVWQHYYAKIDGHKHDIMEGGGNACAWFVSGILTMHKLIESSHATVDSTVNDLRNSGWIDIQEPQPGAVILYGSVTFEDGSEHTHLAFYLGDDKAVSTSYTELVPVVHDWRYRDHSEREVTAIFWKPELK